MKLSELRRIGWREWDPIGLGDESEFGPECCADEYDRYLKNVVILLARGGSRSDAAEYLGSIARDQMGLSEVDPNAAKKTVDAIAGYLKELPDSPHIAD